MPSSISSGDIAYTFSLKVGRKGGHSREGKERAGERELTFIYSLTFIVLQQLLFFSWHKGKLGTKFQSKVVALS